MFGDRDLKKLKREIEDGQIAMQVGPRLGPEAMETGVENTLRDLMKAAQGMQSSGRWDEASLLIQQSRFQNPDNGEQAWNDIADRVLAELG